MKELKAKVGTIIAYREKILLIKEKFWTGSGHKWNFGTGSFEESDTDMIEAAKREAKEEVGLNFDIKGIYKVAIASRGTKLKIYFIFVADSLDDQVTIESLSDQEKLGESIIDYKWFSREEILAMADEEFATSTIAAIIKGYLNNPTIAPLSTLEYFESEFSN